MAFRFPADLGVEVGLGRGVWLSAFPSARSSTKTFVVVVFHGGLGGAFGGGEV